MLCKKTMRTGRWTTLIVSVALLILITSCGAKVKTTRMVPAKFKVSGIRTLAVADFKTNFASWNSSGNYISELIRDEVRSSDFYDLVEGAPTLGHDDDSGNWNSGWHNWGEKNRVDGILAGSVKRAGVSRDKEYRKEEKEIKTGKYKLETYWENGQQKKRRVEIVEKRVENIPVVTKSASIEVRVALYEVASARRTDTKRYTENDSDKAEGDAIGRLPSDSDMLRRLASKIASDIANDLIPHPETEKINLSSEGTCKEGAKIAKDGDWSGAKASWETALSSNSENHCALYDLGVAAEVAKDYAKAERYYLNALDIKDKRLYRKALQRAGKRLREKEKLDRQMEGRK